MNGNGMYAGLMGVIGAGVAVVTMTFGLFGSVLGDLLPQVDGAAQAVNFFSFGTLIVLLALTLLVRERIKAVAQIAWAIAAMLLLVGAVFVFFSFRNLVGTYTYRYPPDQAEADSQLLIRGDYHEKGRIIVGERSTAAAVAANGGLHVVLRHNLLWTEESRNHVIDRMVRYYAAITFLMTSALFAVAIAVWRTVTPAPARGGKRGRKQPAG